MKERVKPAGRQERRIFPNAALGSATAHQASVLEALGGIRGALGDMSGLLDRLAPAVIAQKTIQLDATGTAQEQFRLPFRSIAVDYFGTGDLTVAAQPLGGGAIPAAPGPGVGIAHVGPGGFAVCNMRATVVSFYGLPGDFLTFTCFASPQAPCGVASVSAAPQEVVNANPAAGSAFVFTVPAAGPALQLVSAHAFFVASAVVANRFISIQIQDGAANILASVINAAAVVASTSLSISWLSTVTAFASSASGTSELPIPMRILEPGWTLRINASSIDVGDQFSQINLVFSS